MSMSIKDKITWVCYRNAMCDYHVHRNHVNIILNEPLKLIFYVMSARANLVCKEKNARRCRIIYPSEKKSL